MGGRLRRGSMGAYDTTILNVLERPRSQHQYTSAIYGKPEGFWLRNANVREGNLIAHRAIALARWLHDEMGANISFENHTNHACDCMVNHGVVAQQCTGA